MWDLIGFVILVALVVVLTSGVKIKVKRNGKEQIYEFKVIDKDKK